MRITDTIVVACLMVSIIAETSLRRNAQSRRRGQLNQSKNPKSVIMLVAAAFILLAATPNAAETDGAYFRESIIVHDTMLKLVGTGLLRHWGFKVYVGALYLEEGCPIDEALSDRAKRIEIQYEGRYYADY